MRRKPRSELSDESLSVVTKCTWTPRNANWWHCCLILKDDAYQLSRPGENFTLSRGEAAYIRDRWIIIIDSVNKVSTESQGGWVLTLRSWESRKFQAFLNFTSRVQDIFANIDDDSVFTGKRIELLRKQKLMSFYFIKDCTTSGFLLARIFTLWFARKTATTQTDCANMSWSSSRKCHGGVNQTRTHVISYALELVWWFDDWSSREVQRW